MKTTGRRRIEAVDARRSRLRIRFFPNRRERTVHCSGDDGRQRALDVALCAREGIGESKLEEVAAEIRMKRPPEPYKGKGIHYEGEHIRRKLGKAAK